jgi:O-methyltransferase
VLRYQIKKLLQPIRLWPRRFFLLPSIEEQQFVSTRGCLYRACQFANRNYITGDYLEFGVWKGDSFTKVYHFLSQLRNDHLAWLESRPTNSTQTGSASPEHECWKQWKPRFFAFDSFEGLPEPEQTEIPEEWVKGGYACSEDQFRRNLASDGVNLKDLTTVKGFYDKTLNAETKKRLKLEHAAIVHVDCDLYESTIVVLDFVTDLLVQGSILVFDDWFYNQGRKDRGEQKAFYEWAARNPRLELIEYWRDVAAIAFIVNFKEETQHGR